MIFLVLTLLAYQFDLTYEIASDFKDYQIDYCIISEKGNCQRCDKNHFLFQLPQDHNVLGYKAGTMICVECPYQKFNETNNLYCGDCLDNSQLWDKSRLCTYDYKTKSTNPLSVFHKIERPTKQLFYVIMSGTKEFTTQSCDGCENFCKYQNSTCFPVRPYFAYDVNNLYISCADGYEYSDEIKGCDTCPDNCKSCLINKYIKTDVISGKTVTEVKKICLICNKGFSILTTRTEINNNETLSQCIACFTSCETCYFGNKNLNLNEKPWNEYNNEDLLTTDKFKLNETQFYIDLFKKHKIAQRCEQCTSTAQSTFIPSLNRRTCVRCGTNCRRCEYTSSIDFPTRDGLIIEPESSEPTTADIDQVESKYLLRCRECDKFSQTFQATATGCVDCSIASCKLCAKFDSNSASDSTINPNFSPLADESRSVEKCLICEDGYYLSDDQKICTKFDTQNQPKEGCLTYLKVTQTDLVCLQCNTGYTLKKNEYNEWVCEMNCASELLDYRCQSCVKNENGIRCQKCLDGFYVDMETGKCEECSKNGNCKKCYTLSLKSVHHPEYINFMKDGEEIVYGPFCIECNPGDDQIGPILNEDLRYCEKGGPQCSKFQAIGSKGYCDQCLNVGGSRSSTSDGYNCIECPEFTIGCRERLQQEKDLINPYFDPTNEKYLKYSRISFKCEGDNYFNTQIGRCIQKADCLDNKCNLSEEITINADCDQKISIDQQKWKINSQFNDITQKTAILNLEDKLDTLEGKFQEWNKKAINKIIITLQFQYQSGDNSKCFFQKSTYFTTNIKKNVFSVQDLELKIITSSTNPNEKIKWYIQDTIYFTYFTSVSLNGIELYQATDIGQQDQISYISPSPFGLVLLNNTKSKFYLENVIIGNIQASDHYQRSTYTTPYSEESIKLKKYKPFFTQLLNTYEIDLKNVIIQSQSYILSQEISFQAQPFGLIYDSDVILPYLKIKLDNITFQDIAIESQAIFEIQPANFLSLPEWNNKIMIKDVKFEDCYFFNDGGFLSTKNFNQPMGKLFIDTLIMRDIEYNNSRGIVDFSTMQQIKVNNLEMYNSKVNSTALFYVTTVELGNIYLKNVSFTNQGRLMQTKYELKTIKLNEPDFSGLKLQFINLEFDQVICLYPSCLIFITEIQNNYDIPINVTINGIVIKQINSIGFDETILEAATSAPIRIEKCKKLIVSNFQSIENANLAIFYIEQVWTTKFINVNCNQKAGMNFRNNYCLFINNPYQGVELYNIQLLNLIGRDNSFIGISSWNNLIYNTSTADYLETIIINGAYVDQCTIITTSLAVPSSAILIDSTQMQIVEINFMNFFNNKHIMEIDGSLRPSNPTFLIRSLVGTLKLSDSYWRNNSVQGFGAVLYLEVGTQIISNISMNNSNYDSNTQNKLPKINETAEGGHLYISAFNLSMQDCTFSNSTAKLGGALFLRTLLEGIVNLKNISINYAFTPLDGAVSSRGGCLYIDSMSSQLDMRISNSEFNGCFTRGEGGGIFLISYDKIQNFKIEHSEFKNCYALSGLVLKILFYSRTQQEQKMILDHVKISGNQQNTLDYFEYLGSLQSIEKFIFIKRIAAIEQDYGQIEVHNSQSEGLYYYGYISILQANQIKLNVIQSQNSILSFRPYIEILQPLTNPLQIDSIQFRNISSISIDNLNCTNINTNGLCLILDVRLEFSEFRINPALMLFDQIYKDTPLKLQNIAVYKVVCKECHGGLIQIMRVSNQELVTLVEILNCRCSSSQSSYYGCFSVSSEQYFREQSVMDQQINIALNSNLTAENIKYYTNLTQMNKRILQSETVNQTENNSYKKCKNLNSSYFSNIIVSSLTLFDVKSIHGGGISFYGLTANVTDIQCSFSVVSGRGGCIYFESYPKEGGCIFQRLNIAESYFYRNNASIGGAIAVVESGINNIDHSNIGITFQQNYAKFYGNEVAQYPTSMGIKIKNQLQKQLNLDSHTGWLNEPIIVKSGYEINKQQNQTLVVVFLDQEQRIMNYQFNQSCSLSINYTKTINENLLQPSLGGNSNNNFSIENQGFDYSGQIINYDPYSNFTLDIVFYSDHTNIPIYHQEYPYQCIGFDTGYTLQARIRSLECEIGEAYNNQSGICIPCKDGEYQLVYKERFCKQINYITMNQTYRNKIMVKQYHWRPSYDNDQIEFCRNKKENCNQGFDVGNDLCQVGLIGALCEECDIFATHQEQYYYNSVKYECQLCSGQMWIVIIPFVFNTILFTVITVKYHELRIAQTYSVELLRKMNCQFGQHFSEKVVLLKIFLNFIQLVSIGGLFITQYFSPITIIGMPIQSLTNALNCLLPVHNNQNIIYNRLIASLVIQLICIVLTIFILFIMICCQTLKRFNLGTLFTFIFLYLLPTNLIEFLNLILKRHISGEVYIQANVSYKYGTSEHLNMIIWFVLPGICIIIIVPFILHIKLLIANYYGKLKKVKQQLIWGSLYHEYLKRNNSGKYYWEFFRIYLRILICIFYCIFAQDIIIMVILSIFYIFFYSLLANIFLPYQNNRNRILDQISSISLIICFLMSIMINEGFLNDNQQLIIAGTVIIYLCIVFFTLACIYNFFNLNSLFKVKFNQSFNEDVLPNSKAWYLNCRIRLEQIEIIQIIYQPKSRKISKKFWDIVRKAVLDGTKLWNCNRNEKFKIKHWYNDMLKPQSEGIN